MPWYSLLRPSTRLPSTFAEKYHERVSPEAFELLQAMFQYNPSSRPTAADVLEHPYFTTEEPKPERPVELAELLQELLVMFDAERDRDGDAYEIHRTGSTPSPVDEPGRRRPKLAIASRIAT